METVVCYKDRDNSFLITLTKNGVTLSPTEMSAITKFEIKHKGIFYNSIDNPSGFVRDNTNGTVQIKPYELGFDVSIDRVEFIVYDSGDFIHGLLWSVFVLKVSGEASLS